MHNDRRAEPREQIALPLQLAGGGGGTTRDISASGVFFETSGEQPAGSEIDLSVELDLADRVVRLHSRGRVLRVERWEGRAGVAVKLLASRLEAVG